MRWNLVTERKDGRRQYRTESDGRFANVHEWHDYVSWDVFWPDSDGRMNIVIASGQESTLAEAANEAKKYLVYGSDLLDTNAIVSRYNDMEDESE